MRGRGDLAGQKMFDAFPSEEGSESHQLLKSSLDRVLKTGEPDELALIRYDIENPDGSTDARYWSATHTPIHEGGQLRYILQHTVDVTEVEKLRQHKDAMGIFRRAKSVQDENRTLRDETRRLLALFHQAPGFTAVLMGTEHRFAMANEAYRELVGRADVVGRTVEEALPEVADQGFIEVLDNVYRTGEPYFGRREEVFLVPEGESEPRSRFLNFVFQPVLDDDDLVRGIIIQGNDVTDEVLSLERQQSLVNELNHRVKNTLAIVQGLAMQSFRTAETERGRAVFEARLRTLATAHNLLTEGFWGAAEVADVVRQSAETTARDALARIDFSGDLVRLPPQTAVSLAMIIHELCTNAMKYGALSNESGSIAIRWHVVENGAKALVFEWKEQGGPAVTPPERPGFGTRLISRGVSDRATGSAEVAYEPDGLRFSMRAELEAA
ncbi:sensor histidine kinase [Erythrobacter sp. 3-20A1M]|uniref:sensor histidine kinase n=1 Tax=Erythrobacter sp. 3-20A1M TaxID=2653850 RepID=UPI00203EB316|nr:PAS domain-containing sensor histidine kinase [Erythrobacter sp. 3-20A1M]